MTPEQAVQMLENQDTIINLLVDMSSLIENANSSINFYFGVLVAVVLALIFWNTAKGISQ